MSYSFSGTESTERSKSPPDEYGRSLDLVPNHPWQAPRTAVADRA